MADERHFLLAGNARLIDLGGTADRQCVLVVDVLGSPATVRWYDFYAAGIAVQNMCILSGQEGTALVRK